MKGATRPEHLDLPSSWSGVQGEEGGEHLEWCLVWTLRLSGKVLGREQEIFSC